MQRRDYADTDYKPRKHFAICSLVYCMFCNYWFDWSLQIDLQMYNLCFNRYVTPQIKISSVTSTLFARWLVPFFLTFFNESYIYSTLEVQGPAATELQSADILTNLHSLNECNTDPFWWFCYWTGDNRTVNYRTANYQKGNNWRTN